MKTYQQIKKQLLKDSEIKRAYEKLVPEFLMAELLIKARLQKQISQRELAQRMGTKQSAISRLESGRYNPSLSLLYKVADALNVQIKISIGSKEGV